MPQPPVRVLLIETNEDGTVGGSHKALFDLAVRLDRARWEPVVLFYQANRYGPMLEARGIEVHSLEPWRTPERAVYAKAGLARRGLEMLAVVRRRAALLRTLRIQLVHVINSPRVTCDDWLPATRLVGIPCISSEMLLDTSVRVGPVRRALVRRFDRILPVSRYQEAMVLRMGVPRRRVTMIPHGLDAAELRATVDRPRAEVRRQLGVTDDMVLVAMVGNLRRWKGQHVLIDALALLPPGLRTGLRVVFAGSAERNRPEYEDQLRQAVLRHGLQDIVQFLGFRTDAAAILEASDIAVHASIEAEPGGIAVMEAMALGTAVIASELGGAAEMLDAETGIRVAPERPAELADALARLLTNPERRQAMAAAAKRRIAEYGMDRHVRSTEDVYAASLAD